MSSPSTTPHQASLTEADSQARSGRPSDEPAADPSESSLSPSSSLHHHHHHDAENEADDVNGGTGGRDNNNDDDDDGRQPATIAQRSTVSSSGNISHSILLARGTARRRRRKKGDDDDDDDTANSDTGSVSSSTTSLSFDTSDDRRSTSTITDSSEIFFSEEEEDNSNNKKVNDGDDDDDGGRCHHRGEKRKDRRKPTTSSDNNKDLSEQQHDKEVEFDGLSSQPPVDRVQDDDLDSLDSQNNNDNNNNDDNNAASAAEDTDDASTIMSPEEVAAILEGTGLTDPVEELRLPPWIEFFTRFVIPTTATMSSANTTKTSAAASSSPQQQDENNEQQQQPSQQVLGELEEYKTTLRTVFLRASINFVPMSCGIGIHWLVTASRREADFSASVAAGVVTTVIPMMCLIPLFIYYKVTGDVPERGVDAQLLVAELWALVAALFVPRFPCAVASVFAALVAVLSCSSYALYLILFTSASYVIGLYNLDVVSSAVVMTNSNNNVSSTSFPRLASPVDVPHQGEAGELWFWVAISMCMYVMGMVLCFVARTQLTHLMNREQFTERLSAELRTRLCRWDLRGIDLVLEKFHAAALIADLSFPVYISSIIVGSARDLATMLPTGVLRDIGARSENSIIVNHNNDSTKNKKEKGVTASIEVVVRAPEKESREGTVELTQEQQGQKLPPLREVVFRHDKLPLVPLDDVTILHLSIVQCAALFEFGEREPAALAVVRGFVDRACEILTDHHAVILEVQENGTIVAQWGAPRKCEAACALACCAALHIQAASRRHHHSGAAGEAVTASNRRRLLPLTVNIGIHHGPALVGSIGSSSRRAYTAIGPAPSVASALCRVGQKVSQCFILASNAVIELAQRTLEGADNDAEDAPPPPPGRNHFALATALLSSVRLVATERVLVAVRVIGVTINSSSPMSNGGGGLPVRILAASARRRAAGGYNRGDGADVLLGGDADETAGCVGAAERSCSLLLSMFFVHRRVVQLLKVLDEARCCVEALDFVGAAEKYAAVLALRGGLSTAARAYLHANGVEKEILVALQSQCESFVKMCHMPHWFRPVLQIDVS